MEKENPVTNELDHEHFMRLAIEQGKKVPESPFGSVIVNKNTNQVISSGWVRVNCIWQFYAISSKSKFWRNQ